MAEPPPPFLASPLSAPLPLLPLSYSPLHLPSPVSSWVCIGQRQKPLLFWVGPRCAWRKVSVVSNPGFGSVWLGWSFLSSTQAFPEFGKLFPGKCGLGPHSCSLKSRCDEFVSVLSVLAVEVFDLSFPFPKWALQGIAFSFLKQFFFFFFLTLFLQRGEGGRKRGRHRLVSSHTCPNRGTSSQPRHVPWRGIELATFRFAVRHAATWATPVTEVACRLTMKLLEVLGTKAEFSTLRR